ncbi:MAG: hypothetical protein NT118_08630 [Lentisphaerae bacterium]|nr:hypothetical protein [Lentisphaerota bacterium]
MKTFLILKTTAEFARYKLVGGLGGHSKTASDGHLKTGQSKQQGCC